MKTVKLSASGLFVLLLLIIISSCGKPVDNRLEEITDTIIGQYRLQSGVILGEPLDLNCDGVAGTDIEAEFKGFPQALGFMKSPVRVFPALHFGEEMGVNIEIPKQRVNYMKTTGHYVIEELLNGGSIFISFKYYVDEGTGNIVAGPEKESSTDRVADSYDITYLVDYKDNEGRSIRFDQDGGIEVVVDCTFYDYSSDSLVNAPVMFKYERFSYSLY